MTDPRDAEQARKALHKAEKEHCSNFDKGAVFHWAEKGAYVLKADAQAERDAALAQVAAAITGNKSGTICRDCRDVGMIHCSDPFNCCGMQPYTVEELKAALSRRDAQMRAEGRKDGLREAAAIAYRVCAETRHVTLGQEAERAILAAAEKEE